MKKRILKLALIICVMTVLFAALSVTATASSSGTCGTNLTWTLDYEGTLTISGNGAMNNYVSSNAPWDSRIIINVEIENGVTSIGDRAFYNCSRLTSITIPDSVTSIGSSAFEYCSRLTSIEIPNSVTSIGDRAFSSCSNLTSIEIPNSVTSIGSYAFSSCSNLTSIEIPNSVTSIGSYAFSGCSGLTSITIPDSVPSIGSYAFRDCSSLTSITIPDSVTSIGDRAFYNCSKFTSITIPDSVTSIGSYAFAECTSLQEIILPFVGSSREEKGTNSALFGHVFGNISGVETTQYYSPTNYVTYKIPSSLKSVTITDADIIPYGAFYNCSNLENITLNSGVKTIYPKSFYNCSYLLDITIPAETVKIASSNIFSGCEMLTVHGIKDSDVQEYAAKFSIDFEPIGVAAEEVTLTASANVIEGNIVVTAKANGSTTDKFIPVALYDEDNKMLDLMIIPSNEVFEVVKIVFKDTLEATYLKLFMWESFDDVSPLEKANKVDITR